MGTSCYVLYIKYKDIECFIFQTIQSAPKVVMPYGILVYKEEDIFE